MFAFGGGVIMSGRNFACFNKWKNNNRVHRQIGKTIGNRCHYCQKQGWQYIVRGKTDQGRPKSKWKDGYKRDRNMHNRCR